MRLAAAEWKIIDHVKRGDLWSVKIAIIRCEGWWRVYVSGRDGAKNTGRAVLLALKTVLDLLAIVLHYCSQSREIGQLAFPEGLFLISVGAERDGAI